MRRAKPRWTSSRSGSRCTSTTPGHSSARRSTTPRVDGRRGRARQGTKRSTPGGELSKVKLVWFVPGEALDATREAVFEAGAGRVGDYERCSWYAAGTGTFFGGPGTSPTLGESGRDERVAEYRVETVVPEGRIRDAIVALRLAHPYEEPAYDVYPLVDQ